MGHVIKRAGHQEKFDNKKLYASIYASCLAAHEPTTTSEKTAEKVTTKVSEWLKDRQTIVTSNDLRLKASEFLNEFSPDAAYSYAHHRIMW